MTFDDEKVFEQAVINQLIESGWESKVLRYPTEKYNGPAVKTKKEEIYREQLLI